jgi:hypothetical protein
MHFTLMFFDKPLSAAIGSGGLLIRQASSCADADGAGQP